MAPLRKTQDNPWWAWPAMLAMLPLAAVAFTVWLLLAALLLVVVWLTWWPAGRYALLVYSDSPVWNDYFQAKVLPILSSRAHVLNWSERAHWSLSLPVLVFHVFGGPREFNPMAIVFKPFAWPREYRFYRPFLAFKRGKPDEVERLRRDLFEALDRIALRESA